MSVFGKVLERVPARVIELTPDMFGDEWPDKPDGPVPAGLRLITEGDQHTARAQAAQRAIEHLDDPIARVEAYNDTLMAWAVASALCDPSDVRHSFFDSPFENVFLAFTSEGIRRIYEELEVTHLLRSPLRPEIDGDELIALAALLNTAHLATLGPKEARIRRLLSFVLEELRP